MKITLSHGTYEDCTIQIHKYDNGRPALVIYQYNQVIAKATVNMPDHAIPEGYVFIKNWVENEGMLMSLIDNDIVDSPVGSIPLGFVSIYICKLNLKEEEYHDQI